LLSARRAAAFATFGFLFGVILALPPAAVFWRWRAPLVWLAPCFAEAWAGATGTANAATLAAVSWVSVWVILVLVSFSALVLRMTIHPSAAPPRQGKTDPFRHKFADRGEHLAIVRRRRGDYLTHR
jgi:hypothetical protein